MSVVASNPIGVFLTDSVLCWIPASLVAAFSKVRLESTSFSNGLIDSALPALLQRALALVLDRGWRIRARVERSDGEALNQEMCEDMRQYV